jgi:hypothetical protein
MNSVERGKQIAAAKRKAKDSYQGGSVAFGFRKTTDGRLEQDPETYECLESIKKEIRKSLNKGGKPNSRKIAKAVKETYEIKVSSMTIYRIIKKLEQELEQELSNN